MDRLIDLILQFGYLNKQQIDLITSKATILEFKKDEYFSEAGKVPRHVGFVLEGVFRFCYYNNKGEEITNYFVDENNFVVDNQKFEAQMVASEYVQAVTDCKVIAFSKRDWDEISNTIVGFEMIKGKVTQKCLTVA
ncbi:MAG: cyclic nucleotide-binding domain-containing protein, partial [Flavitalea sp.]